MAFDWREYLELARFLYKGVGNNVNREAAFRCAVSRAYFSAYCHARNYARDRQGFTPKENVDDHWNVKKHFLGKKMITLVDKLDRLRQWRNCCDYDDTAPGLPVFLTEAIDQAQEVFDILK